MKFSHILKGIFVGFFFVKIEYSKNAKYYRTMNETIFVTVYLYNSICKSPYLFLIIAKKKESSFIIIKQNSFGVFGN